MSLQIDVSNQILLYKKQQKLNFLSPIFCMGLYFFILLFFFYIEKNGIVAEETFFYIKDYMTYCCLIWFVIHHLYIENFFFSVEKALKSNNILLKKNKIYVSGKLYEFHKIRIDNDSLKLCFCDCD